MLVAVFISDVDEQYAGKDARPRRVCHLFIHSAKLDMFVSFYARKKIVPVSGDYSCSISIAISDPLYADVLLIHYSSHPEYTEG